MQTHLGAFLPRLTSDLAVSNLPLNVAAGVDPDRPSRHASWVGELPSARTSSNGDLLGIEMPLS